MENLLGTHSKGNQIHIEGFPDGVKVIQLDGPIALRLSHLALHRNDIEFANHCLDELNNIEAEDFLKQALWRSSVIHFFKCFGESKSRFKLIPEKIYKNEPPEAMVVFNYFRDLRNKHFIHDENSYTQINHGAILNRGDKDYKIEKIVCITTYGVTLTQENFVNLKLLIKKARTWIVSEFDKLANKLANDLEQESYEALFAKDLLSLQVPTLDEINQSRSATRKTIKSE